MTVSAAALSRLGCTRVSMMSLILSGPRHGDIRLTWIRAAIAFRDQVPIDFARSRGRLRAKQARTCVPTGG
jgi:hypothetical protein